MDAHHFLEKAPAAVVKPKEWLFGASKVAFGLMVLWIILPVLPDGNPLLIGWIGMLGLIFVFHFGLFHLLALGWRAAGFNATPLMNCPIRAKSLAEFWNRRWNTAFHALANAFVFRPLCRRFNPATAILITFILSGLVHEMVISVPARGGYGGPTTYFLIQGLGLLFERAWIDRTPKVIGWLWTVLITAGPAMLLFHPAFVERVILPFLTFMNSTPACL
jgi:alginate O-acetyltransferase complex protein AlgI